MAKTNEDLLDWTVAEAPDETEAGPAPRTASLPPPPPRPAPVRRWELPRRAWLMLAALALTAMLVTVFALPWLEGYRVRRAVTQVIAAETEALRAGDWDSLLTYYDPAERAWVYNEIEALKAGGQPLVLQSFSAYPPQLGGTPRWVRSLAPGLAQAEVEQGYRLADGTSATFALTQFYRYSEGAWRHTAPPDDWWGETRHWQGVRVDLAYPAADAAYAAELGPYLDSLAVQACARWLCAPDLRVPVEVAAALGGIRLGGWGYSRIDSLAFSLLASGTQPGGTEALPVPSPHIAGHPRDQATLALTRQPIAVRVLLRLALQAHGPANEDPGSVYFFALVARDLARLGLEPPTLTQLRVANPVYSQEQLWSMTGAAYSPEAALTEALVTLNHLLDGQPSAAEAALLRAIGSASDLTAWLATGLNLSEPEVTARLAEALNPLVPLAARGPAEAALVMQCQSGPWLATREGQAWPLLTKLPGRLWTWPVSWSPDGQRLAVVIAGRGAVMDLAAGTANWLPQPLADSGTPLQWVSDTVVAYGAISATATVGPELYWPANVGVHFYDTADLTRRLAPLPEVHYYLLAPDKTRAVVALSNTPGLSIIPALGGAPVRIGGGSLAQWSPDSTQIAFLNQDASGERWSLRLADADTGQYRTLLDADDPRVPALDFEPENAWVNFTWSPRGDRLVVYLQANDGSRQWSWAGLLAVDGAEFQRLEAPEPGLTPAGGGATFSADGRTLALPLRSALWEGRTALYAADTAGWLRTLPEGTSAQWAAPESRLIVSEETGTYLAADPMDPAAPRQRLADGPCYGVDWRPG